MHVSLVKTVGILYSARIIYQTMMFPVVCTCQFQNMTHVVWIKPRYMAVQNRCNNCSRKYGHVCVEPTKKYVLSRSTLIIQPPTAALYRLSDYISLQNSWITRPKYKLCYCNQDLNERAYLKTNKQASRKHISVVLF